MEFSKESTRVNGYAVNGRCIVKGTMKIPIQTIRAFMSSKDIDSFKKVTTSKITLEAASSEKFFGHIGKEVILENSLRQTLPNYETLAIDNPKSLRNIILLIESTKGKLINDLIIDHVEVEVWKFFNIFESDISFIIDDTLKTESTGLLIPELEGKELKEGEADEPSVLDLNLENTKLKGGDVKRIIMPGE